MSDTYNDLMGFQKSQIASFITEQVMEGETFTWSTNSQEKRLQPITVQLDEQSDVPVTLPSEVKAAVNNAMTVFNCAPDGFQLVDFLPIEQVAA